MAETIPIPTPNVHNESSLIRSSRSSLEKKQEPSKVQTKPLKGGISKKQPSFKEKLKRSFVKEDIKDIRDYVVFDVIIPSIKKSIFDTVVGTAAQVFGIRVPRNGLGYFDNGYSGNTTLSPHERRYRDYTSLQRDRQLGPGNNRLAQYDRFYATDYPFTYKEDADATLEMLMDICDEYNWVSVAKFFEIADPEGTIAGKNPYTNNDYGWSNIDGAVVKFDGNGYVITLPPAHPKR